ncbi:unnamed protein product, partial [marine sediment metagenome]
GTYSGALTLVPQIDLHAVISQPGVGQTVTVAGNATLDYDSGDPGVKIVSFVGIKISAASGTALTYAGTAKKGLYFTTSNVTASAGPVAAFGGTGTTNQLVLRNNTICQTSHAASKIWTVSTATGVTITVDETTNMSHSSAISGTFDGIDMTTASQSLLVTGGSVTCGILISASATIKLVNAKLGNNLLGTPGTNITVNVDVAAGSYVQGVTRSVFGTDVPSEIEVGGTNAASLIEAPGNMARYPYLVGDPGLARHTDIQDAIDQAVTDGH